MISDAQLVLRPMTTHQIGLAGFLHLLVLSQRVRKVAPPHPNGRQDARHSNGSRLLPAIHRSPAGRTNSSLPRLSPQVPRIWGESRGNEEFVRPAGELFITTAFAPSSENLGRKPW